MRGARWWVLLVLLALAGVITRQGVLLSLALTLGVATGVSHLWERFGLSGVSYERRLAADHLFPGEETALTVTVTNLKPLPLPWLVVRDRMPQGATLLSGTTEVGGARSESSLLTSLPMSWYQRVVRTHRLRGDRRGWYRIGPAELETGDVFGFGRTRRRDETTQQLVVYPRIQSLETLGLPADRPMVEWLGLRRLVQDSLRFATVRDYAPGDSPRHIHWKATARARSLQTKVFDPGASLSLTLAVDVQTTDHLYEHRMDWLERILSVAASLAVQALDERHLVGLCINAFDRYGERWTRIAPGRSKRQAAELLTALAGADCFRSMPFEEALHQLLPLLPMGDAVVAISARADEGLQEALLALKEAGRAVYLLLVGDESMATGLHDAIPWRHIEVSDAWSATPDG